MLFIIILIIQVTKVMGSLSDYFNRVMNGPPFRPGEEMKYEAIRLSSFKSWPHWANAQPTLLAKAGFYFTGREDDVGDEVCCFSCKGKIKEWQKGDDPISEHRRWFPECTFDTGRNEQVGDNVSLEPAVVSQTERSEEPPSSSLIMDGRRSPNRQAMINHYEYKYEMNRLASYITWPTKQPGCPVNPDELAKAGFYFLGEFDRVQCAFCFGILHHWEPGDSAIIEHKKHFPNCPFMCEGDVGNVPMISEEFRKRNIGPATRARTVCLSVVLEYMHPACPESEVERDFGEDDSDDNVERKTHQKRRKRIKKKETEPGNKIEDLQDRIKDLQDRSNCIICIDKEKNCLLLPCHHYACCDTCVNKLNTCPVCRCLIRGHIKVFNS